MSRLLAIAILLCVAMPAAAISRHSSMQMTCDEIWSVIEREGAAIFRYPSPRRTGLTLYDRYVRDDGFCTTHQTLEKVRIPSRDGQQCTVRRCTSNATICNGLLCD